MSKKKKWGGIRVRRHKVNTGHTPVVIPLLRRGKILVKNYSNSVI